jgi:hypothetical protein
VTASDQAAGQEDRTLLTADLAGLNDRDLAQLGDLLYRAATHRAASTNLAATLADLARQVLGARRNIDTRETH